MEKKSNGKVNPPVATNQTTLPTPANNSGSMTIDLGRVCKRISGVLASLDEKHPGTAKNLICTTVGGLSVTAIIDVIIILAA